MHLAELNIAKLKYDLDDPRIADFVNNLQRVNGIDEWFKVMDKMQFAMWWVEPNNEPTVEDARRRLDHLQASGPSDYAFGWESLPNVKMWKEARCA